MTRTEEHGMIKQFKQRTTRPSGQTSPRASGTTSPVYLLLIVTSALWSFGISIAAGENGHHQIQTNVEKASEYAIPKTSIKVFLEKGKGIAKGLELAKSEAESAVQTVVESFNSMVQYRQQYPRFDEALRKNVLQKIVIEPKVFNRFAKEFLFLVARTKKKEQVVLLINASRLKQQGYINHPKKLIPRLEREFQWVLSKAATKPKSRKVSIQRDLKAAPIKTVKEIKVMSGEERKQVLQALFQTYLTTVDDYQSLTDQLAYEVGSTHQMKSAQPDSTTKFYDIRIREALQILIRDPYFVKHTPKAIRNLLNGRIWNVSFVKIDSREWATRTRVAPKDKSVSVGKKETSIQPAKILVNYHRKAEPEDPFYSESQGLPMGALSANQLAHVIALEIETNITDKSMRGHVAQDERTAPE